MINLDFGYVRCLHINLCFLYMYSTSILSIKQHKDGITIEYKENAYINYILDFLTNFSIKHTHKKNNIFITCNSSQTLIDLQKQFNYIIPHHIVGNICHQLSSQIQYIHQKDCIIDRIYRKDFIILNESIFLYVGAHHIKPITSSNITIYDNFYSFGVFLIKLLLNKDVTNDKYKLHKVIEPIYYTPIYWTLLRCMDETPENRVLLYI